MLPTGAVLLSAHVLHVLHAVLDAVRPTTVVVLLGVGGGGGDGDDPASAAAAALAAAVLDGCRIRAAPQPPPPLAATVLVHLARLYDASVAVPPTNRGATVRLAVLANRGVC